MGCVIAVVVWAGTPLYSMTFLAGLQAIPKELYEAAEIDGASVVQQFFYVTVPRLKTIFLTTVMLSTIWTATNLQFVFVLTRGGPASRTEIFPHLAYMTALGARRLGMGAAVSLVFFPVLVVLIVFLTRRMLRGRRTSAMRSVTTDPAAPEVGGQRPAGGDARVDAGALLLDDRDLAQEGQGDLRLRGDADPAAADARRNYTRLFATRRRS